MLEFNKLSYWEKETYINHTDYLVIGSGIVGLSTAIHLKQRHPNKKVTVLERGYLPTGASSKNAGFSCIGSPTELLDDLSHQPATDVFATVAKRWEGLNYLRSLLGDTGIDYQSNGSYELFTNKDVQRYSESIERLPELNKELEKITGIKDVFRAHNTICQEYGFNGFNKAINHKAEGQIDTGRMIRSLLQLAYTNDINILNGIKVETIENKEAVTSLGKIKFEKAAICTNGFARHFLPAEDVNPARAQVVVTSPIPDLKTKGIFHFDQGYYYFRNIGNRILFGGGRNLDFKGEQTEIQENTSLIVNQLEHLLKTQILPETPFKIEHQWAGTMGVGQAKKPIIKAIKPNLFCGIRLGGMGVAIGSIVGKELAELMTS